MRASADLLNETAPETGTEPPRGAPLPDREAPVSRPVPSAPSGAAPTILLALPYAASVRDILRTEVFATLKRSGARLVLLTAAHDQPEFVKEFGGPNVHIEPLVPYTPGEFEARFDVLRYTLFSDLTETIGVRAAPNANRALWKKGVLASARSVSRLLGRRRTETLLARTNMALFPDRQYGAVLDRYRPDLVCLTRVFGWAADHQVLKAAVKRDIPTMLLVSSWDNLTSKGVFPARPDRLVVWNELMAEEAVNLHGFPPDRVQIGGVPQFDIYADKARLPDRQTFFRRVGADPDKALITFAMSTIKHCPDEFGVIELLWQAIQDGKLNRPAQLLARLHPLAPHYNSEMFPPRLKTLPGLLFDVPGRAGSHVDRDSSLDDMRHLAATMWHSDVVLNTSSTIAIDAAALDTPVVCAGFDGHRQLPYNQSVRRLYDYTHFKKLLALGGARVAHSLPALVDEINAYLADPQRDSEGRRRVVQRQCSVIDGKSGQRFAQYILDYVAESRAARARPGKAP